MSNCFAQMPFVQIHRMQFIIPSAIGSGAAKRAGKLALRAAAVAIKQLLFQPEHKGGGVESVRTTIIMIIIIIIIIFTISSIYC